MQSKIAQNLNFCLISTERLEEKVHFQISRLAQPTTEKVCTVACTVGFSLHSIQLLIMFHYDHHNYPYPLAFTGFPCKC